MREKRFSAAVAFDGRLDRGEGGYRQRCMDPGNAWPRVHITAPTGALSFTFVSARARNQVSEESDQRQAVDGLIRSVTADTNDQPGLSRALFELIVPNEFKEPVAELPGLILAVDKPAAAYPWELMRDEASFSEPPLAARIGIIRQLASPYGRRRVQTVSDLQVLAVGDTQSDLVELTGAQEEARQVAGLFGNAGWQVTTLIRPSAQQVFVNLFDSHYRCIHLAGHGVVAEDDTGHTGMVLGPGTYLTPAQISKLNRVPEFVFLNCCHLGSMAPDARPRWGKLAANLATEFIEMGCKAVIAAGWAVDDQAASTFACSFYAAMLSGERLGEAVRRARWDAWDRHRASNTWGAFQAYGDERYSFLDDSKRPWKAPRYVHSGQLTADLELLLARLKGATREERGEYARRLAGIEEAGARWFHQAEVRERLGAAWADLGDEERAIGHYRAALTQEDGEVSLHALEQLARLEIHHGAGRAEDGDRKKGLELMAQGHKRLEVLIGIAPTVKRLSLLARYWKLRLQLIGPQAGKRQIEQALHGLTQAWWDTAEESLRRTGKLDPQPLLNALDGAFLLKARGQDEPFDRYRSRLAELLSAATENGRCRFGEEPSFFHALVEVEAQRVDALWACLDGREAQAITQPKVQESLAESYSNLIDRLGTVKECDSTIDRLRWLMDLLPPDQEHDALRKALEWLTGEITRRTGFSGQGA